jgi:hypothetical protein
VRAVVRICGQCRVVAVSEKLGYRRGDTGTVVRRGPRAEDVRHVVDPAAFVRPGCELRVEGAEGCLGLLGAA